MPVGVLIRKVLCYIYQFSFTRKQPVFVNSMEIAVEISCAFGKDRFACISTPR
jgi:hypothetical protein